MVGLKEEITEDVAQLLGFVTAANRCVFVVDICVYNDYR